MNIKKNEFAIGTVMIFATLLLVFGIFWLGNSNFLTDGLLINVKLEDANGIAKDDGVYYRGMKVGFVQEAKVQSDAVVLKIKIEGVDKISKDSKFLIKDISLIGGKIIEIIPGSSVEYLSQNSFVTAESDESVIEIVNGLKDLKPKIEKVLQNVDNLTGATVYEELQTTIHDLHLAINDTKKIINGSFTDAISNYNDIAMKNDEKISTLITSLNKNSRDFSQFLNQSSSTALVLDSLLNKVNGGEGTIGAMVKYDSLYKNLNNAVISIDSLVSDIKKNPSKYVNVSVF